MCCILREKRRAKNAIHYGCIEKREGSNMERRGEEKHKPRQRLRHQHTHTHTHTHTHLIGRESVDDPSHWIRREKRHGRHEHAGQSLAMKPRGRLERGCVVQDGPAQQKRTGGVREHPTLLHHYYHKRHDLQIPS